MKIMGQIFIKGKSVFADPGLGFAEKNSQIWPNAGSPNSAKTRLYGIIKLIILNSPSFVLIISPTKMKLPSPKIFITCQFEISGHSKSKLK